jgi:hypothetical protein
MAAQPGPRFQTGNPDDALAVKLATRLKIVHNGIEYGIMAAYSEGLIII